MARARLDRHHELAARAVLSPSHPPAGEGRARGRRDGARVRPDRAAARASWHRRDDCRSPRRRVALREVARDGLTATAASLWAKPRAFDVALSHASYDLTLTARGSESLDHDVRLRVRARAASVRRRAPPRASSSRRQSPQSASGVRPKAAEARALPRLKEEYYLADFEPDPLSRQRSASILTAFSWSLRPPAGRRALPPRQQPALPADARVLGRRDDVHAVVLPRTEEQRAYVSHSRFPRHRPGAGCGRPEPHRRLDLVISAGGTMNREAVALGVPVYTEFRGPARRRRRAADPRREASGPDRSGDGGAAKARSYDGEARAPRTPRFAGDSSSRVRVGVVASERHRGQGGILMFRHDDRSLPRLLPAHSPPLPWRVWRPVAPAAGYNTTQAAMVSFYQPTGGRCAAARPLTRSSPSATRSAATHSSRFRTASRSIREATAEWTST